VKIKPKKCVICRNEFNSYNSLDKCCSVGCQIEYQIQNPVKQKPRKPIKRVTIKKSSSTRQNKKSKADQLLFEKNVAEIKQGMIDKVGYIYCECCHKSNALRFEGHHIVFRSEKPKHPNLNDKENILITADDCHVEFHKNKGKRNNIVKQRKLNLIFGDDILDK
jgi:hypothetical protein